jgi:hypothetical protein
MNTTATLGLRLSGSRIHTFLSSSPSALTLTVFPMIRHEIRDLPLSHQSTMKQLYIQWLGLLVTLIINLVACILLLIAGSSDGGWVARLDLSLGCLFR